MIGHGVATGEMTKGESQAHRARPVKKKGRNRIAYGGLEGDGLPAGLRDSVHARSGATPPWTEVCEIGLPLFLKIVEGCPGGPD